MFESPNLMRPPNIFCSLFELLHCTSYGEERYEKRDLQLRVRQRFGQLEKLDLAEGRVPWHVVSAAQSVEAVHADICKIVQKTLAQVKTGNKKLGKLWEEGEYVASINSKAVESEKENENII